MNDTDPPVSKKHLETNMALMQNVREMLDVTLQYHKMHKMVYFGTIAVNKRA